MIRSKYLVLVLALLLALSLFVTACDDVSGVVEQAQATGEAVIADLEPTLEAAGEQAAEALEEASEEVSQEVSEEAPVEGADEAEAEAEAEKPHWSYEGETGPEFWGSLGDEYETCDTGTEQSPVDIPQEPTIYSHYLPASYGTSNLNIFYNGHTVQVKYDPGSTLDVDGDTYRLDQFHFHTPSEHEWDGEPAPLEMHLVHRKVDDENALAVVGLFIISGAENPAFASVIANLPTEQSEEPETIADVTINVAEMLPEELLYLRYNGSLTTPGCTEGVKWHVLGHAVEMSEAQIGALAEIMGANNRPVQPLNDRHFLEPGEGAEEAGRGHWSYAGESGPDHWAAISPDCNGRLQSPINVTAPVPEDMRDIIFNYTDVPLKIFNSGHTIEVEYADGSTIQWYDAVYNLAQFHFHSPSEHTVDGVPADAEMHLVHRLADDEDYLLVIGVLIVAGAHNPAFDAVWANLPTDVITTEEEKAALEPVPGASVDATNLLPENRTFYSYDGSLTTPPCSEGVRWLLLTTPIEMSPEQIAAFRAIISANNRPLQELNDRGLFVDTGTD